MGNIESEDQNKKVLKENEPVEIEIADEEGATTRVFINKWLKLFIAMVAVAMTVFHIVVLGFYMIPSIQLFCVHWGLGLMLTFWYYPYKKGKVQHVIPSSDIILSILVFISALYMFINFEPIIYRTSMGLPNAFDLIAGGLAILLTLEAGRRTIGIALPLVVVVFLAIALFGRYLPSFISNRGYSVKRLISYLMGNEGLFAAPLRMSATDVFLLVTFGAFLTCTGVGNFFMELAMRIAGKNRGGPAKVAVISSCLFGTISGSAVANVIGTGNFTIPLMKKNGYSPEFAGAVEAVASTGGQIMPPVMGAGAFVMAEMIGMRYSQIAAAALIPAMLYYFAVFVAVDIEAAKNRLKGVEINDTETTLSFFFKGWYLLIPLVVLIYSVAVRHDSVTRAALLAILSCCIVSYFKKETRLDVGKFLKVLELSAFRSLTIIAATALAGLAIGTIMLTGLGMKLTLILNALSQHSMLLALIIAAITASILGMGLPTVAAYIISASVLASGMMELGMPVLVAHMFLFFYSVLAMITPPVALAAYAGANIARCNPMRVGMRSVRLGLIAFILPFFFAYAPELLLIGTPINVIWAIITSIFGTYFLTAGLAGWCFGKGIPLVPRAMLIIGSLGMIFPGWETDLLGLVIIVGSLAILRFTKKDLRENPAC